MHVSPLLTRNSTLLLFCLLVLCPPAQTQEKEKKTEAPSPPAVAENADQLAAEDQLRFAEGNFKRNFFDLAAKEYRIFLKKYPNHPQAPEATLRLITCLRVQGKTQETLRAINDFQGSWPQHKITEQLYLWRGEILFNKKQYAAAASCFNRLTKTQNSVLQETAVYFLAQCSEHLGKIDEALEIYKRIADKEFDGKHVYRPYATFAIAIGRQQKDDFGKAAELFRRLAEAKGTPDTLREEATYRLAEFEFSQKQFAKAAEHYRKMLIVWPQGLFAREAAKRLAWAMFSQKNYREAIERANHWITAHDPRKQDFETHYILGASLMGIESYKEALPVFQHLLDTPQTPPEYLELARFQKVSALLNLKDYEKTIAEAERFIANFSKSREIATVFFFAGKSCFELKNYGKAIPFLRKALDSQNVGWIYQQNTNLLLSESLIAEKRFAEAAKFQRKLSSDPQCKDRPYYLLQAGLSHRKAKNEDAAITDFETLLKDFPEAENETRTAMFNLGELYSGKKDYKRSEVIIRELLGRDDIKTKGQLSFFLGYLCFQQKRYKEAVTQFRAALETGGVGTNAVNSKYYLALSLFEIKEQKEALKIFAEILPLPDSQLPAFNDQLLLKLDSLFYTRGDYALSERIANLLRKRKDGETIYDATLRLVDILIARDKTEEAIATLKELETNLAEKKLNFTDAKNIPPREEVRAVLGEIWFHQKKYNAAAEAMEACLKSPKLNIAFKTRARWVLAEILLAKGYPDQALPYAFKCFILDRDPTYSPRGMFVASRIFEKQGETKNALQNWLDLEKQYPAYAAEIATDPLAIKLSRAARKLKEAEAENEKKE